MPLPSSAGARRKPKRIELSDDQRLEIKEAFELFDTEKSGTIGFHELKVCLKAFGFNVKKKDINDLRREYDQKQTGRIDFIDFSDILTRKISERDPLDEVKKAFRLFDDDGTGKITLKNLRRVARELGETLSDDELQAMIDEFDMDNDGEISEAEFIAIMTQSALL